MKTFDHRSGEVLEVDGARIYYETVGREGGPDLLLLHGGFGTLEDFNVLLPELGARYRVIGIDSRGHGRSTLGPEALTYQRLQQDVERVVDHLGLDRFSVIGFSDGGVVAYRMASGTSSRIEKLVTIGADWEPPDDRAREIYSGITGASWRGKFPESYELYQRLNPEPDFDRLARSVVAMWLDTGPTGYPGDAVERLSCDLLIVRGDDDHLVSGDTVAELNRRVGRSRLLSLPSAGHIAFQDQPELFLSSVAEFLG